MPNTKTKKFDWQIFLAVSCILLVICCATIFCVIGNTEKGVASAQENDDYLVVPGESYTSIESHASIFNDYYLNYNQNTVYFNFNFKYDETEFFNVFSEVIEVDYSDRNGGLDDSYYAYPLFRLYAPRSSYQSILFTVLVLGWDSHSSESGIYIMDDNFIVNHNDEFFSMLSNFNEFWSANYDFVFARFTYGDIYDFDGAVHRYKNYVTNNFLAGLEGPFAFATYFDSTWISEVIGGYYSYEGSVMQYFDGLFSANGIFNDEPVYIAPELSGIYGSEEYSFNGYCNFNYNIENNYLNTLSSDFMNWLRDDNSDVLYYDEYGLIYVLASCCTSDDPFRLFFGLLDDGLSFVIVDEETGALVKPIRYNLSSYLPFGFYSTLYFESGNFGFSYISPFWYSDYCSLDIGMFFSMSDNFLSYGDVQVLKQQKVFNEELAQKDEEIARQDGVIDSLQEDLRYYESLELNYRYVPINYLAGIKTYSFTKDGINYSSNSIERSSNAREIYNSYNNAQLDVPPESMGVCFAIELDKTYNNVKFKFSPIIDCYYQYTICSEPDESGTQQCYQHNGIFNGINVGYVRQNGEIEYLGQYSSMPGASNGEFLLNYPTNTLVFYFNGMTQITLPDDFALGLYMYDPDKIYNDGYQVGFNKGYTEGKNVGYYEGLGADTDISFFALFTSVFDAPITSIVGKWGDSDGDGVYEREGGMLNFYIPGLEINFAPFLLSLFTIAVIVLIIRFILARKS